MYVGAFAHKSDHRVARQIYADLVPPRQKKGTQTQTGIRGVYMASNRYIKGYFFG